MAEPARPQPLHAPRSDEDSPPPHDPIAIDRAYLQERARRRARLERTRARRRATARYWTVLVLLLAVSVVFIVTTWREVERLFGL
jgi:hypothetical protein